MRILYLGDLVGEKTIDVLQMYLEPLKKEYGIQLVLCNAENLTKGKGLSLKHYKALKTLGIGGISMGNHTFSKSEIKDYINEATICRPANWNTPYGKEVLYIRYNDQTLAVVNLLGRVFFNQPLNCPFQTMETLLKSIQADKIIVDFHAEATSEKKLFSMLLPVLWMRWWAVIRTSKPQTNRFTEIHVLSPIWGCAVLMSRF